MASSKQRRRKAGKQAAVFGALSLALYAAVFAFADPVTALFAKGGVYTLLPVGTVFVFSYVHGNFAGNVWTALGIEASSSAGKKAEKAETARRTDTRGRATLNA